MQDVQPASIIPGLPADNLFQVMDQVTVPPEGGILPEPLTSVDDSGAPGAAFPGRSSLFSFVARGPPSA